MAADARAKRSRGEGGLNAARSAWSGSSIAIQDANCQSYCDQHRPAHSSSVLASRRRSLFRFLDASTWCSPREILHERVCFL